MKHNKPRVHALYRLVQYENCFTVYRDIIRSYMMTSMRCMERKTNLFIRTAQLTDKSQMMVDKIDTFEQLISILGPCSNRVF